MEIGAVEIILFLLVCFMCYAWQHLDEWLENICEMICKDMQDKGK